MAEQAWSNNQPFMAQWHTTESPSANSSGTSDSPLPASPRLGSEERNDWPREEPGADPSAEPHERRMSEEKTRPSLFAAPSSCGVVENVVENNGPDMRKSPLRARRGSVRFRQRWMIRTRQQIGRAADQKPVHLIAVVALSALVAGVLLRVWRSSHYE